VPSLVAAGAAVAQIYALGRLLPPFRLGTWKSAITGGDTTEKSLSARALGSALLLDLLDLVLVVRFTRRAVGTYSTRNLHVREPVEPAAFIKLIYTGVYTSR